METQESYNMKKHKNLMTCTQFRHDNSRACPLATRHQLLGNKNIHPVTLAFFFHEVYLHNTPFTSIPMPTTIQFQPQRSYQIPKLKIACFSNFCDDKGKMILNREEYVPAQPWISQSRQKRTHYGGCHHCVHACVCVCVWGGGGIN